MGYILPYTPVQLIQYQNRVNFQRWPAVSNVERATRLDAEGESEDSSREQFIKMLGKGRSVDEKA